jgi:hypothetical protein
MMLKDFLQLLNVLFIPLIVYIVCIEKRLTKIETILRLKKLNNEK